MRKKIAAGNWKMNLTYAEAMALVDAIVQGKEQRSRCEIVLSPPYVYLHGVMSRLIQEPDLSVSAQNCASKVRGAFTGEVSASMLASIGVDYVIIGHSERRAIFGEDDPMLAEKVTRALENDLIPIFCCGETLEQRNGGSHFKIVKEQLEKGLFVSAGKAVPGCVIAYEPVWAIGTGINATAAQAQEMHQFIRSLIRERFGENASDSVPILYGGSVSPSNASELFKCPDVDGGLVGGASLKPGDFLQIIFALNAS